jgi:acyl-coenzyme A synthetase/AMP-(fatty) acid ligase
LAKGDENFQRLFTGDIATFDEFGYFYIVGRTSRIAKIYGVRINLEELDSYLYSLGVTSASVTDDSKIRVFAEGKFSETITHSQICKFLNLREGLVVVKAIDSIPRTSSGKVDFRELSKWV